MTITKRQYASTINSPPEIEAYLVPPDYVSTALTELDLGLDLFAPSSAKLR